MILVIVDVWLDRWIMSMIFGGVSSLLGAGILTAGAASTSQERKESRIVGLILLIIGAIVTLLEACDRLMIGHH